MRVIRRFCVPLIIAVVALSVAACGSSNDKGSASTSTSAAASGPKKVEVTVVLKAFTKDFWRSYRSGAQQAGLEPGVDLTVTAATNETDTQGQISKIEEALTKGVDALVVAPISPGVVPTLEKAQQQGVPVILVENVEGFTPDAVVSPDPVTTAGEGAKYIVDKLGKDVRVGLLTAPGIPVVDARLKGAKDALKAAGVKVVSTLPAKDCAEVPALNSTQDLLQAHPDVNAIYAMCSPPDLGAITAIKQAGKAPGKDVHVYGYNGDPPQFVAIQKGTLDATVDQQPATQGKAAVEAAAKAARGEKLPKDVFTKVLIVDKSNVASR
jgi:ribose transport system substrate-binding protein